MVAHKDIFSDTEVLRDNIYLIQQFYIDKVKSRYEEIKYCLKRNAELGMFKKIILLNEKIYSAEELGVSEEVLKTSIEQININKRMFFSDIFRNINKLQLKGYIMFSNSDIFYDNSIQNIFRSFLSLKKIFFALTRYEYKKGENLSNCKMCEVKRRSQDTWIFHTNISIGQDIIKKTRFQLGKLRCDTVLAGTFKRQKFIVTNPVFDIKTYHFHTSEIRNYIKNKEDHVHGRGSVVDLLYRRRR